MTAELIGQFGLSKIGGRVGWWISLGQHLVGDSSPFTHAFIVVSDTHIVEAMPSGARLAPLNPYLIAAQLGDVVFSDIQLTDEQRATIAETAYGLVGTPYSFLDYLAIALDHWGIRPRWLRRYIAGSGRLICSQLIDVVMQRAGIHLFSDGRDPGDVSPGDLANYLITNRS